MPMTDQQTPLTQLLRSAHLRLGPWEYPAEIVQVNWVEETESYLITVTIPGYQVPAAVGNEGGGR